MKKIKKIIILILLFIFSLNSMVFAADNSYKIVEVDNIDSMRAEFSEGLCAARDKQTQHWGFVDKNGNWIIQPQFRWTDEKFRDGCCVVYNPDGESLLINRKGETVYKGVKSYQKRGKYGAIQLDSESWEKEYILVDENFNNILSSDIILNPLNKESTDLNDFVVFFKHDNVIYNYKGEKVSEFLYNKYGYTPEDLICTSGIYLVYYDSINNKPVVLESNGRYVADFPDNSYVRSDSYSQSYQLYIYGDIVKIYDSDTKTTKLYDIYGQNLLTIENQDIDVTAYYNKYIVLSKYGGTCALYKTDGTLLVDFGRWDKIIPSSVSGRMMVVVNNMCGIANFDGDIEIPLEYQLSASVVSQSRLYNKGKTAALVKNNKYLLVDMATLNTRNLDDDYPIADGNGRMLIRTYYSIYKLKNTLSDLVDLQLNTIIKDIQGYPGVTDLEEGIFVVSTETGYKFYNFNDGGGIKVKLDGMEIPFDTEPIVQDGRTLVPLRAIFETLGATVNWNGTTQTVTSTKEGTTISMTIGQTEMYKNGEVKILDVAPQIVGGRTLVPVRAIAESFDIDVDWNGYTNTVILSRY